MQNRYDIGCSNEQGTNMHLANCVYEQVIQSCHVTSYSTSSIGWLYDKEVSAYFLCYSGLVFDLLVGPMLLWRPTLMLAIALSVVFHLTNHFIFKIGIFPWVMLASVTLFLPPAWPRWVIAKLYHRRPYVFAESEDGNMGATTNEHSTTKPIRVSTRRVFVMLIIAAFVMFWILFPMRHILYEGMKELYIGKPHPNFNWPSVHQGDVVWNEQGHTFSWRMKLRTKRCSGELFGYQPEGDGLAFEIPWRDYIYCRNYYRGMTRPWMIIQLAHMLGEAYASPNGTRAEIYYNVTCIVHPDTLLLHGVN